MEDSETTPQVENEPEEKYPVSLRPPLFSYLAESLRPVYQRELDDKRRDGSYAELAQFHRSRLALLMTDMLGQFSEPDQLPPKPSLLLSKEDVSFLEGVIPNPSDAAGVILRNEMTRELKDKLGDAKMKARIEGLTSKIKSKFKR